MNLDYKRMLANAIVRRIAYVLVGFIFSIILSFDALAYDPDRSLETFDKEICFSTFSGGGCYAPSSPRRSTEPAAICQGYINKYNTDNGATYTRSIITAAAPTLSGSYARCTYQTTQLSNGNTSTITFDHYSGSRYSCPSGTTASGNFCTWTTACPSGEVRNSAGVCEPPPPPPCTAGEAGSPAFYNYGTDPNGSFPYYVCQSGCNASFNGSAPATRELVGGVYNYFALGFYTKTGDQCTSGESPLSTVSALPPPSCGSGQVMGTVNGKTVCANAGTGQIENPNAPKTETTQTQTTTPPVTNPDGSTTTTTTITNNNGTTTTITNTTNTDGTTTSTTETTSQQDPQENAPDGFCAQNPQSAMCKEVTGSITGGSNPSPNATLYTPTYTDGLSGIYADFQSSIAQSSFNQAIQALAPNWEGGTCPSWSMDFSGVGLGSSSFNVPCYIFDVIGIIFLITALFTARSLVFGG